MPGASHPSIPARCARRPHHSSTTRLYPFPSQPQSLPEPFPGPEAPGEPRSGGGGRRGARALPGRPGRAAAGGGGSGARRRLGRGRAGTAGEGRRKRRRTRAITAGIINNRKKNNHRSGGAGAPRRVRPRGRSLPGPELPPPAPPPAPRQGKRGDTHSAHTKPNPLPGEHILAAPPNSWVPSGYPQRQALQHPSHSQTHNIPVPGSCSTPGTPKPLLQCPEHSHP